LRKQQRKNTVAGGPETPKKILQPTSVPVAVLTARTRSITLPPAGDILKAPKPRCGRILKI
jgi:hypothetical protein